MLLGPKHGTEWAPNRQKCEQKLASNITSGSTIWHHSISNNATEVRSSVIFRGYWIPFWATPYVCRVPLASRVSDKRYGRNEYCIPLLASHSEGR